MGLPRLLKARSFHFPSCTMTSTLFAICSVLSAQRAQRDLPWHASFVHGCEVRQATTTTRSAAAELEVSHVLSALDPLGNTAHKPTFRARASVWSVKRDAIIGSLSSSSGALKPSEANNASPNAPLLQAADSQYSGLLQASEHVERSHDLRLLHPIFAMREISNRPDISIELVEDERNAPWDELVVSIPARSALEQPRLEHWYVAKDTGLPLAVHFGTSLKKTPGVCLYDFREYKAYTPVNGLLSPQVVRGSVLGGDVIEYRNMSLEVNAVDH